MERVDTSRRGLLLLLFGGVVAILLLLVVEGVAAHLLLHFLWSPVAAWTFTIGTAYGAARLDVASRS